MLIIAHRGYGSRERTENTLQAFEAAVRDGAHGIECDLRVSKDGEIVILHDANLHRVAGDAHKVSELTVEELQNIQLRHGGTIPTLNDLTSHIPAPILLDLEVKHFDAVVPLLRKLDTSASLRERAIVASFNPKVLKAVRQAFPEIKTFYYLHNWPLPLRGKKLWKKIQQTDPWAVALRAYNLNRRRVAHLHDLGYKVGAWDERGLYREARRAVALDLDVVVMRRLDHVYRALNDKTKQT